MERWRNPLRPADPVAALLCRCAGFDPQSNSATKPFRELYPFKRVLGDDCQIFIVQTGLYEGANLRALAAERRMEQLAVQTGGAAYIPKTISDLETAFKQIAADLAQQYVLSYYQAEEHRDGRFHVLDLRIRSRKDVRVRARKGYYSPKSTSMVSEVVTRREVALAPIVCRGKIWSN